MKQALWFVALVCCPLAVAANCEARQPKSESALVELEQSWAKALERQDSGAVACILADEFQDTDPNGQVRTRAESLAHIAQRRPGGNQLSDLQPHLLGDIGYVRGLNTVIDHEGKTVAKVRFTDVFVYRAGRWLAVAAHESLVSEAAK